MKKYFFVASFFCLSNISAQNIIQDNKGGTALSLNAGTGKGDKDSAKTESVSFNLGIIKLSSTEKKAEMNYYQYFVSKNNRHRFFGVSAAGEIKNSIASLLASGNIAPQGNIKLKSGFRLYNASIPDYENWEADFIKKNNRPPTRSEIDNDYMTTLPNASDLWLVMDASFTGSKFKLFYPDSTFSKQIQNVKFTSWQANIGVNYWNSNIASSTVLAGLTIGLKKENNFDDLVESTEETTTLRTSVRDSSTRKVIEKNTVYKGAYKEFTSFPLQLDLYFKPHALTNVAFLAFSRVNISKEKAPSTKVGGGVYFLKKNNLFDPVFGINIDYNDVFNTDNSDDDKSNWNKLSIGIVMRLNMIRFQTRN